MVFCVFAWRGSGGSWCVCGGIARSMGHVSCRAMRDAGQSSRCRLQQCVLMTLRGSDGSGPAASSRRLGVRCDKPAGPWPAARRDGQQHRVFERRVLEQRRQERWSRGRWLECAVRRDAAGLASFGCGAGGWWWWWWWLRDGEVERATGGGFALLASLFSDPLAAAAGLWRTTVGTNVPQSTPAPADSAGPIRR